MAKNLCEVFNKYQPPYHSLSCSVREMAADLGIGLLQAYTLAKVPGFPCKKTGHTIRISKEGLLVWLASEAAKFIEENTNELYMKKLNGRLAEQTLDLAFRSFGVIEAQIYKDGKVLGQAMVDSSGITQMDNKLSINIFIS